MSSQKKKIHKYYKKMVQKNMTQLQSEYTQSLTELQRQYDESLLDIKEEGQHTRAEHEQSVALKMAQYEKEKETMARRKEELKDMTQHFDAVQSKEEGYKLEIANAQSANGKLRDEVTAKCSAIKQIEQKYA